MPAYGQNAHSKGLHRRTDTTTILHDIFSGVLSAGNMRIKTILELDHKPYYDMGGFVLMETYTNAAGRDTIVNTSGEWTVLKGDAGDDNATVVELYPMGRSLYFLRRKDGALQKLDTALREIKPVKEYLLLQHPEVPATKGSYKGASPCADCTGIETVLTLHNSASPGTGTYTLSDKYMNTRNGNQQYTSKGKWDITSKTIITLHDSKTKQQTCYLITAYGDLLPLGKDKKVIDAPFDMSLKKQK